MAARSYENFDLLIAAMPWEPLYDKSSRMFHAQSDRAAVTWHGVGPPGSCGASAPAGCAARAGLRIVIAPITDGIG